MQVRAAEAELRHKLLPPNAWMKVLYFNGLTSCPKDDGLLDFTLSTSYQPSCTATHKGSRRGSHVYEINAWMWNFGRHQPGVGGLLVAKTDKIRNKSRYEAARRAWKTKNARKRPAEEEESS
jgi:hypothetical protein